MFSSRSRDVRFQRFCLENRHTLKDIDAVIDGVVKIEQNSSPLGSAKSRILIRHHADIQPAPVVRPAPKLPASGALFCYLQGD